MARLLLGALPRSAQFCLSPTLIQVRHAQKRKKPIDFYSLKALEVQSAISEEFELPRMMLRQAKGGGSGKAKPGFLVSDVSGGTGQYFKIVVLSTKFLGVSPSDRKDMVYNCVSHLMDKYQLDIRCHAIVNKDTSGEIIKPSEAAEV
ncbi:uncharacterized protein LOC135806001 [Sycon ciliatum]|uniref:uncharacterized protein LOC135806001 n=1 Tax=Sycon ciliatum TaxID=27933 RepID=UPI0020A9D478|eukprot:scpid100114/ scgid35052/ 